MKFISPFLLLLFVFAFSLWSVSPVPYSGKIDIRGVNYFGEAQFAFSLYDGNGTTHWRNGNQLGETIKVTIRNGRYNVLLGGQGMSSLAPKLFLNHDKLYLKVEFDNEDGKGLRHLAPDQLITATPRALVADIAKIAELAKVSETVSNGAITRDMLSSEVLSQLDANATASPSAPVTITRDMLPQDVRDDLNKTVTITRSMLPADILSDLNRTITKSMLSTSILSDLNRTITRSELSASILADLNRTISKNNLGSDVLSDLNSSISLNRLSPEVLAALQVSPSISTQPFARYDWRTNSATIEARGRGHNLSYQWLKNGQGIAGANAPVLELSNPVLDDNATYSIQLTNSVGQTTSHHITLQQAIGAPGLPLAEANATQVPRNGLVLWLDPNDLNADGLVDNLPTGSLIDSWKSKVGDTNTTQTSEVLKPKSNFFGDTNLKAVAFDGGDYLLDDNASLPVQHIFVTYRGEWVDNDVLFSDNSLELVKIENQSQYKVFRNGHFHKSNGGTVRVSGRQSGFDIFVSWQSDVVAMTAGAGGTYNGTFAKLGIGALTANSNNWEGEFGEILFYDRALSNSERDSVERYLADKWSIQLHADKLDAEQATYDAAVPAAEPENGLVAYYKFEPISVEPNKVWDYSGNDNHLTMSGFNESPWINGVNGKALYFDGGNSMASGGQASMDFGSVTFWAKPAETINGSDKPNIIYRNEWHQRKGWFGFNCNVNGKSDHFVLWMQKTHNDGSKFEIRSIMDSNFTISSQWIHVGLIYDGDVNNYSIYLNGSKLSTSGQTSRQSTNAANRFYLGNSSTPHFRGSLDEFKIYDRSLTPAEVEGLYLQVNNPILRIAPEHNATVGTNFSLNLAADNGPTTYLAEGLPTGLSLNTTTGQITGSLSQPGYHRVFVKAMNDHGTGSDTIAIVARPQTNEDGWPVDIPSENDVPTNKLALWLDANDVDANASPDNMTDGSELNTWKDKSGDSRHATQSNNSDKPIYRSGLLNGLSVIRFSSEDNRRAIGANHLFSFGTDDENGLTIIAVANSNDPSVNTSSRKLIDFGMGTAKGWGVTLRKNGGNFFTPTDHNGSNLSFSFNKAPGDWSIAAFRVKFELLQEVFVDGNLLAYQSTNLKRLTNEEIAESHHRHGTGGSLTIGGASSGGGGSDPQSLYGDIAELMIWKRALTDSERVVVERYLAQKWGLQHQTYLPPLEQPETGLLGRWTFDEGEGDLVHDVSGNRKHGTMTNMHPTNSWTDGAYGKALEFDGSDDNLTIPSLGDEYRTIAMWINAFDMYGRKILQMHKISGVDYTIDWGPKGNNDPSGSLYIRSSANSTWLASGNSNYFRKNGWHHLAVRWNVGISRYELFADGYKKGTLGNANNQMEIINSGSLECSNYLGKLDDLRIYSRSLTDLEIKALCDKDGDGLTDVREAELGTNPNLADTDGDGDTDSNETIAGSSPTDSDDTILGNLLTNGLQVHLKFDETNGTTAFDSSGNNRYAELHGVDGNSSTWVQGKIGGALSFDGVNDWGSVSDTIAMNSSVSFWLKTNDQYSGGSSFSANKGILTGPDTTTGILFSNGNVKFYSAHISYHSSSGRVTLIALTKVNVDSWFHFTTTMQVNPSDSNKVDACLYVNGALNTSGNNKGYLSPGSPLLIGKNGGNHLVGSLDDLRIYDRTLSAAEVQSLYNLGQ